MTPRPGPLQQVRGRILVAAAFCAAAFGLVGARLVDVMIFNAEPGGASANIARHLPHPMRADLVDRNNVLIARDLPVSDLYAQPSAFWNIDEAAELLSPAIGVRQARLKELFAGHTGYVPVKRGLNPDQKDAVMRLGLPGLTFEDGFKRFYPEGRGVVQAVGRVDIDDKGVSGLELGLNSRVLAQGEENPVALSFDMRVQYVLADEVAKNVEMFHALAGGGIVMDVRTGEVLAMVSLPDATTDADDVPDGEAARNRMTQDVYELGSIFKIFSFSEAVEERTIRMDEAIDVGHPFRVSRFAIGDSHRLGPILSAEMVFAESSNIGTAQIAKRSGPEKQRAFLGHMGLFDVVKTELPEVARPLVPSRWGDVESATISFGQGISVSPLAFVAAASAVVNGGTRIEPTFLKRNTPQAGERLISENSSAEMRRLLRLVVEKGTGTKAAVPGYDVGGKTGSAEKPGPHGGYAHTKLLTSFFAAFPIEKPRYAVFVMLDEPKATKETFGFATAGWTAAPMAGRVVARIAPLLGVPRKLQVATADRP